MQTEELIKKRICDADRTLLKLVKLAWLLFLEDVSVLECQKQVLICPYRLKTSIRCHFWILCFTGITLNNTVSMQFALNLSDKLKDLLPKLDEEI